MQRWEPWLFLFAVSWSAAQEVQPPPEAAGPALYRIVRVQLPPGPEGVQAAVSRGYYLVNFGSREGVERGSLLEVYSEETLMGVVRVEQVWRDSAAVQLIELVNKADPGSPNPLEVGFYLKPKQVFLGSIPFVEGKPDLSLAVRERLRQAVRFLRAYPDFPLVLEGHTDDVGKEADNLKLSEERARMIGEMLREVYRLPASQIHVKGYGEALPLTANATEEGRRRNRRVELVLLDKLPPASADSTATPPSPPSPARTQRSSRR